MAIEAAFEAERRGGTPFQPQFAFLALARPEVVSCQSSSGTMRRWRPLRRSVNGRGVPGAAAQELDAPAVEGWEFPKPLTCAVETDPDHENFRRLKQGPATLNRFVKVGRMVGRYGDSGSISAEKSRARLASPQPRPTSPVDGAGGLTGCHNDAQGQKSFLLAQNIFHTVS